MAHPDTETQKFEGASSQRFDSGFVYQKLFPLRFASEGVYGYDSQVWKFVFGSYFCKLCSILGLIHFQKTSPF